MNAWQVCWFVVLGVLIAGYTVLDGYDLGVGIWYLFARTDRHRRALVSSILPYWDANEVWLIIAGASVFAAFPLVYASVFSGLYIAMMLLLFGLIFRAVSIEFVSQDVSNCWRRYWGVGFTIGSFIPALLLPVAMGNVLRGFPIDRQMNLNISFFGLLNPYSLLIGVTGIAMFLTHGALWLRYRLEGDLAERARAWARWSWVAYMFLFAGSVLMTALTQPHLLINYHHIPSLWIMPFMTIGLISLIGWLIQSESGRSAFIASSFAIISLFATLAIALFPRLVPSLHDQSRSLTIMNSSSSPLTLSIMLAVALIGMTLALTYTIFVRRLFEGRAQEDISY